jgi:sugar phosphate isomerase/epimerase
MKLGVTLASLGLPFRQALGEARRLGVAGVQADAVGDLAPDRLTETGKREVRRLLSSHGLELTAVGCPMRHGLDEPTNLQPRIDHVCRVSTLSFELGAGVVVVSAGRMAYEPVDPREAVFRESLLAVGRHADRVGAVLALSTGLESGETLERVLGELDTGGLRVNYDPAAMLIGGFDPVDNLSPLKDRLAHTYARDARRINPSRIEDVPIGHGDIDWLQYLGTLGGLDYRGYVVIARETGSNRLPETAAAVSFLRRFVR